MLKAQYFKGQADENGLILVSMHCGIETDCVKLDNWKRSKSTTGMVKIVELNEKWKWK